MNNEEVLLFMKTYMIDTREFSDIELEGVLFLLNRKGLQCLTEVDGYRNFQYYALTYNEQINKIAKCAIWKPDRKLITKDEFLSSFGLTTIFEFY